MCVFCFIFNINLLLFSNLRHPTANLVARRALVDSGLNFGPTQTNNRPLRLLTHVGFLRQNGLILSEVFRVWKEATITKKNIS